MDITKKAWNEFLELCLETEDPSKLLELLDLFLTAEEKDSVAMRYMIIKELMLARKTQRDIAKDLSVSIAKITRGSNELKRVNERLLAFLRKHYQS